MRYSAFKTAEIVTRTLPLNAAYAIARIISAQYSRANHASRMGVARNLQQIGQTRGQVLSLDDAEKRARDTFIGFGRHLIDFFRYHRMTRNQIDELVDLEGFERFDELLKLGRGIVVVTAHLGSWEICGSILSCLGLPISAVALPQPSRRLNEFFQRHRMAHGMIEIPFGSAARECLRTLRRNEAVGLLADRDFTPHQSTVPFFGRAARLTSGPARLARFSKAPILPLFLVQLPGTRFRLIVRDPILPETGMTQEDLALRIAEALEETIREYPTQWFVFHNFWDLEADVAVARAMREKLMGLPQPSAAAARQGVRDLG